ncbi:uncharacterized protein SEPMUDRAFT_121752 [Sphaerulina musiva SO2202]|uniref:HAT C-terminal dimerisation domain-containing protein n=1 Tax=Sphaerulina musiva (strain SO2202) TaxID=692275 RepID=M3BNZ3_SPHMS|nr:uncharacterized protein SEPMUDRAFT_121752 [Sphaerulina musiva SO2202]EMF07898.1 hypothetical protein SEPMUDRAFT_121752 [Sphaerulina musiva SO2202]
MARDILCIPAAGVRCERDFSIARHQSRFNRQYTAATFSGLMEILSEDREQTKDLMERISDLDTISDDEGDVVEEPRRSVRLSFKLAQECLRDATRRL